MMPIKAVILDWAGTVVDHGSRAPMGAFVRAFAQFGVSISIADARGPMGMAKWDHIRAVGQAPAVAAAWRARHGRAFSERRHRRDLRRVRADERRLGARAMPTSSRVPSKPWRRCAARSIRIGSTTGYTRPIMAELVPIAAAAGYAPEVVVCAGDLPAGRPSPLMMWHAMAQLGVWPAETVVKVDDTPPGIGEGINAGTWTVGIALTGNIAGLSAEELAALGDDARAEIRARANDELGAAGAHLVIDGIADLPGAIKEIELRMLQGETP